MKICYTQFLKIRNMKLVHSLRNMTKRISSLISIIRCI